MDQFTAEQIEKRIINRWEKESKTLHGAKNILSKCGDKIGTICRAWLLYELNKEILAELVLEDEQKDSEETPSAQEVANRFARSVWAEKANKVFLEDTERFEIIRGKIMRVTSKELATELYFRIKSKEQTFDMASYLYGEGIERKNGGHIKFNVKEFPYGLGRYVKQAKNGELIKPIRVKGFFVLVQMIEKLNANYNDTVESNICMSLFGEWVEGLVNQMVDGLKLNDSVETREENPDR